MTDTSTLDDVGLLEGIVDRIATSLSMLIDRDIEIEGLSAERVHERAAGAGTVHISFKLVFLKDGEEMGNGSVLVPLADAIAMACYLMMLDDSEVTGHRAASELDESTKDALVELASFVATAVDESIRIHHPDVAVRSRGCQGVRADVRPAFPYEEGSELLVGRARASVHEFPEFELILMMPPLPGS